ncbi:PIG-L deacetylase family protein [Actinokineospora bangkokensis]|uniref:GlcNAc-PI de-N-acetylase n=1 Tax=Actinokineospora bangkokensis TaxID=1193682 RepID=A0A1Q9LLQ0_9PSEU|nr:PIG-L family deacetylase [Actinokineospora bangkokensis]OLR92967.1 GlcNAc-PI de-N-acetylase [Actinokineospora bangkokensis]
MTAIEGLGTSEELWRAWPALDALPRFTFPGGPLVVVAPHPDDEVLGAGGLMALAGSVHLVAVTDGEASHPGSTVLAPRELAAVRARESEAALDVLGVDARVDRLGMPDGGIDEDALAAALVERLPAGGWCAATWRGDGHPDHEAVGRAAARACAEVGARLLEFPVWAWHWSRPDDHRVPWSAGLRVDLPPAVAEAKRRAVREFATQVEPLGPDAADAAILPPPVLARLTRGFEVVFG